MVKLRHAVDASCLSDRGRFRPSNEDSACVVVPPDPAVLKSHGVLMVVADGMGGHQAGELASRLTVERVRDSYYASPAAPQAAIVEAVHLANRKVFQQARASPRLAGMGTTCTAVAVVNGLAWLAHVGDSRLYLIRGAAAYRMTEDHSPTMELVNRGLLTLVEAAHHQERNIILRAVGTRDHIEVATWQDSFPLQPEDRLLLCTDGLYEAVTDDEISALCSRDLPSAAVCEALVRTAIDRDSRDNITVALLRV